MKSQGCRGSEIEFHAVASYAELGLSKPLSRSARLYSVRELARRAGVEPEFFSRWKVEVRPDCTVISFPGYGEARIVFAHSPAGQWQTWNGRDLPVACASWPRDPRPELIDRVPQFVVPFERPEFSGPLFKLNSHEAACELDILASLLFTLSRVEEQRGYNKNQNGSDSASFSAFRENFYSRPIVDEYGLAFEQVLTHIFPAWQCRRRQLRVKLSHDIDDVGIPFHLRSVVGHTLRRHKPRATLTDVCSYLLGTQPAYLRAILKLVERSQYYGVSSAVYWKACPPSKFDTGYDPRDPRVESVIHSLSEAGIEQGVHPGFSTFRNLEALKQEVQVVREALAETCLGGRQHYLRWCPETWSDWESCGLLYDSSVGYSKVIGFRAGTSYPYRPWLLSVDREARLVEIPLIAMDCTLVESLGLRNETCLLPIRDAMQRCELVGGVFTVLWHNQSLLNPAFGDAYEGLLQMLANHPNYVVSPPDFDRVCNELP